MKHYGMVLKGFLFFFLLFAASGLEAGQKLPLIEGKEAVATVNGEPIFLEEFNRELWSLHQGMDKGDKAQRPEYSGVLKRIINAMLLLQEARNIGLYELPETQNMLAKNARKVLTQHLLKEHFKDLQPDEEVNRLYKEAVKEYKVKSILFEKRDDAELMEKELKKGADFDELAEKFVSKNKAQGTAEGQYKKGSELLPQIAEAISKMEVGSVSGLLSVNTGHTFFKLEGIRFPENPKEREKALKRKKSQELKEYASALIEKYVKINQAMLDSLDYESESVSFQELLEDDGIIAEIMGENPITRGDLTQTLKETFFHGTENKGTKKRLNTKKVSTFERMLQEKVFLKEALAKGIDKTEEYTTAVKEFERSFMFGSFIEKVIIPGIQLSEKDLENYYKKHKEEYTFPEMIRIEGLAYNKKETAEKIVEKLRKGADFKWMHDNTEHVEEDAEGVLNFAGSLLTTKSLPEDLQEVVTGSRPGDFKLYTGNDGYSYVLSILDVIPPKLKPFEDAKKEMWEKAFNDKLTMEIELLANKLKKHYPVKIFGAGLTQ